jgi:hypothetical protein
MNKLLPYVLLVALVAKSPSVKGQDTSFSQLLAGVDTTAMYDSLLQELRMLGLTGGGSKSFFDVNVGFGNGSFALQNSSYDVKTDHIFYNTGIGYYHKSGFSLSGGLNVTNDNGSISLYQGYVAPSFDYQSKSIATGISYFHYFNKQDLSFYVSPLVNEFYSYIVLKKGWLVPKLAFDYGWGTYDQLDNLKLIDTVRFRRFAPIVRYLSKQESTAKVNDFSVMLSVRHDFTSHPKGANAHYFRYTPSLLLLAGTATYGTNTALNSLNGPRLANLTNVQLFKDLYGSAFAPVKDEFAFQNFNISQTAMYTVGKWYLQGLLTFSYIIPKEQSKWNAFFNVTTGISL